MSTTGIHHCVAFVCAKILSHQHALSRVYKPPPSYRRDARDGRTSQRYENTVGNTHQAAALDKARWNSGRGYDTKARSRINPNDQAEILCLRRTIKTRTFLSWVSCGHFYCAVTNNNLPGEIAQQRASDR